MITFGANVDTYRTVMTESDFSGKEFSYIHYAFSKNPSRKTLALVMSSLNSWWELDCTKAMLENLVTLFPKGEIPDLLVYCVKGNPFKMHDQVVPELFKRRKSLDMVVTLGTMTSSILHNEMQRWNEPLLQMFVGVDDPVGQGLLMDELLPQDGVVGIARRQPLYKPLVDMLKLFKPAIGAEVLFPYDASVSKTYSLTSPSFEEQLSQAGFLVEYVPALSSVSFPEKRLSQADALCLNFDFPVLDKAQELAMLANKHNLAVFTSDLSTLAKAGSFGCGEGGGHYGNLSARLIHEVLAYGRQPATVPLLKVKESSEVRFNQSLFATQGIQGNKALTAALQARSIFTD